MTQHKHDPDSERETPLQRLLGKLGVRKSEVCPACGTSFRCKWTLRGCWCADLQVSPRALERARARYRGCLCPDCLRKLADSDGDL